MLQKAIAQIEKLTPDQQDAIAARFLAELKDEQKWSTRFADTTGDLISGKVRYSYNKVTIFPLSCCFFLMKLDRITSNPNKMNGQPCIRNLRLTVRRVVDLLAIYPNREELFQEFPELEEADIQQALIFASSYDRQSLI